jgi:uncharacterized sulfatase
LATRSRQLTQITKIVDQQIGDVLDQLHKLPQSVIDNTVIIFASDHGEYSGAHGFVQRKIGTVYEEATHIPLIVMDPSGRFTDDTNTIRTGLCSSVDLLNMFVTLGNKGETTWLTEFPYNQNYNNRHDMYSMLKSRWAPGRSYLLFATDEIAPNFYNFNNAPTNILALRTEDTKVGVYADWKPLSVDIDPSIVQLEFYDYSTKAGQLELFSKPNDPVPSRAMRRSSTTTSPTSSPRRSPAVPSIPTRRASSRSSPRSHTSHSAISSRTSRTPPGRPATACVCCSVTAGHSNESTEPQKLE